MTNSENNRTLSEVGRGSEYGNDNLPTTMRY